MARIRQYLIEKRLLTEAEEAAIDEEVVRVLAMAVESAEAAPDPDEPTTHVYARVIEPGPAATEPEPEVSGESVNLITAINRALHEVIEAFDDTVVFGQDVARRKGGVFKATQDLTDRFGSSRCFNTPIAESSIIGAAIGMSATGFKVIPEIQFADYIHPAFDQIVSEAARISFRSDGRWNVPIVIRTPYGAGIHGALYHSQSIEAFYAHVPGLKVVVPSTPADVKGLLFSAVEDPDPVLYLEPKKLYRLAKGPYPDGEHRVPLGRAAITHPGEDVTIITYGAMAHFALEAVPLLEELDISPEVIDLRSIKPLDWPTIEESVQEDLPGPGGLRGRGVRGVRRRSRCPDRRQGVRIPRRPGAQVRPPRCPHHALRRVPGEPALPDPGGHRPPRPGPGEVLGDVVRNTRYVIRQRSAFPWPFKVCLQCPCSPTSPNWSGRRSPISGSTPPSGRWFRRSGRSSPSSSATERWPPPKLLESHHATSPTRWWRSSRNTMN